MDDKVTACLAAWRTLIEAENASPRTRTPVGSAVPRLLGAVEAGLAAHQTQPGMFPPQCTTCHYWDDEAGEFVAEIWPCKTRRDMAAELLGEEGADESR